MLPNEMLTCAFNVPYFRDVPITNVYIYAQRTRGKLHYNRFLQLTADLKKAYTILSLQDEELHRRYSRCYGFGWTLLLVNPSEFLVSFRGLVFKL
jgi:hypothetical protein